MPVLQGVKPTQNGKLKNERPFSTDSLYENQALEYLSMTTMQIHSSLRRKEAGESVEYQMVAANVDFVFIVQSCHYDSNLKGLKRYLTMVTEGGATPYILLTKTDLVAPETPAASSCSDQGRWYYCPGIDAEQCQRRCRRAEKHFIAGEDLLLCRLIRGWKKHDYIWTCGPLRS